MSDSSSKAPRTLAWKLRHSAWLLAVLLGVGTFSCLGFIYCASRVRSTAWKRRAIVVTTSSLVGLVLLVTPVGRMQEIGAGFTAVLWLVLVGYGLFTNKDYLEWRAAHEPASRIAAPSAPVLPAEPAGAPSSVARPGDEAPTRTEPSVPEAVSASTCDLPQTEAEPVEDRGPAVSSWQQAEALAAWHMRKLGFDDAKMTPPGADGGLDVRSADAVAQVKHYATPIGAPVVQQLRGAAHGRGAALFYSRSGYTNSAIEYANDAAVALFTYNEGGRVLPHNHAARILHDRAGGDAFDSTEFENQAQIAAVVQQYFDVVKAKYFEVAELALAAANGNNKSFIFRSLATENARVEAILLSLQANGGWVKSGRLIEASSEIGQAAVRLAEDLERT